MNTHHLELFYYVAKHGGISNACRHIPYGVQQPAVSAQLIRLEEELGLKLFERKPFKLTDSGELLFAHIRPFFGQLDDIKATLTGKMAQRLRLAGPTQMMRDHLPELLRKMEQKFPRLQLRLHDADTETAVSLLERSEVDLAVVVLEGKEPSGFHAEILVKLPQVLLVPQDAPWKSAQEIIKAGAAGKVRLIALPQNELLTRMFHEELRKRGYYWPAAVDVNSTDIVARYVSCGIGVGLAVISPLAPLPDNVKKVELKGFAKLPVAMLWKERPANVPAVFIEELKKRAKEFSNE